LVELESLVSLSVSTSLFDSSDSSAVGFKAHHTCVNSVQQVWLNFDPITNIKFIKLLVPLVDVSGISLWNFEQNFKHVCVFLFQNHP